MLLTINVTYSRLVSSYGFSRARRDTTSTSFSTLLRKEFSSAKNSLTSRRQRVKTHYPYSMWTSKKSRRLEDLSPSKECMRGMQTLSLSVRMISFSLLPSEMAPMRALSCLMICSWEAREAPLESLISWSTKSLICQEITRSL